MLLKKKNPDALDAPMAPAELARLRETLGRTPAQFADDLQLTLYEIEAMEAGRKKIPAMAALLARSHALDLRNRELMAASGLAECAEGTRLAEQVGAAFSSDGDDDASVDVDDATAAFEAHAKSCTLCRARR